MISLNVLDFLGDGNKIMHGVKSRVCLKSRSL